MLRRESAIDAEATSSRMKATDESPTTNVEVAVDVGRISLPLPTARGSNAADVASASADASVFDGSVSSGLRGDDGGVMNSEDSDGVVGDEGARGATESD